MHATRGDTLRVSGRRLQTPDRCGEIIETRGPDGSVPFVVRWDDTGRTTLFFPGSDAVVEHHDRVGVTGQPGGTE
jgi:hypothetical protein